MRTIPPLNPLHVFEVAARMGSFTKAANELGVTQSAVSRQIATLEDYLGTKLFQRQSKWISLTPDGEEYYQEIGIAFGKIARSTDILLARHKSNSIRVAGYPTFAAKWLIPRISRFRDVHRNIQVKLKTSILPVNFDISPFDVAIQLRAIDEMDPQYSSLLFHDVIQPYCSPKFLEKHRLETIEDLRNVKRLTSHYRRSDWRDWFAANGRDDIPDDGDEFPSSLLTYQAAIEGLGVAIGQTFLMRDEVANGSLVPVFTPARRSMAHFVIWNKTANSKTRKFVAWLQSEIAQTA